MKNLEQTKGSQCDPLSIKYLDFDLLLILQIFQLQLDGTQPFQL